MNGDDNPCEFAHYKEIIREQDEELTKTKQTLEEFKLQMESVMSQNQQLTLSYNQVQEEIISKCITFGGL